MAQTCSPFYSTDPTLITITPDQTDIQTDAPINKMIVFQPPYIVQNEDYEPMNVDMGPNHVPGEQDRNMQEQQQQQRQLQQQQQQQQQQQAHTQAQAQAQAQAQQQHMFNMHNMRPNHLPVCPQQQVQQQLNGMVMPPTPVDNPITNRLSYHLPSETSMGPSNLFGNGNQYTPQNFKQEQVEYKPLLTEPIGLNQSIEPIGQLEDTQVPKSAKRKKDEGEIGEFVMQGNGSVSLALSDSKKLLVSSYFENVYVHFFGKTRKGHFSLNKDEIDVFLNNIEQIKMHVMRQREKNRKYWTAQ